MKKIISFIIILAILTSSLCAYASPQICSYSFKIHMCPPPKEGKDREERARRTAEVKEHTNRNLIDFTLSISETEENAKALIVFYSNGKVTNIYKHDISEYTDFSMLLEHSVTPDEVKIFLWKNNIVPLCKSKSILTPETLEYANDAIANQIKIAAEEINNKDIIRWTTKEGEIIALITKCANDAISKKSSFLLTREFATRQYKAELEQMVSMYEEMKKRDSLNGTREVSDFQNKILYNLNTDNVSALVDYLDLKNKLFS